MTAGSKLRVIHEEEKSCAVTAVTPKEWQHACIEKWYSICKWLKATLTAPNANVELLVIQIFDEIAQKAIHQIGNNTFEDHFFVIYFFFLSTTTLSVCTPDQIYARPLNWCSFRIFLAKSFLWLYVSYVCLRFLFLFFFCLFQKLLIFFRSFDWIMGRKKGKKKKHLI